MRVNFHRPVNKTKIILPKLCEIKKEERKQIWKVTDKLRSTFLCKYTNIAREEEIMQ